MPPEVDLTTANFTVNKDETVLKEANKLAEDELAREICSLIFIISWGSSAPNFTTFQHISIADGDNTKRCHQMLQNLLNIATYNWNPLEMTEVNFDLAVFDPIFNPFVGNINIKYHGSDRELTESKWSCIFSGTRKNV